MFRAAFAAVVALVLMAPSTTALAASTGTSTLDGESLGASSLSGQSANFALSCRPNGDGIMSFDISGVATGPYAGTFGEVGYMTFGPLQTTGKYNQFSFITGFRALFMIHSPNGNAYGFKALDRKATNVGRCTVEGTLAPTTLSLQTRYAAVIHPASGHSVDDSGIAPVDISGNGDGHSPGSYLNFNEGPFSG